MGSMPFGATTRPDRVVLVPPGHSFSTWVPPSEPPVVPPSPEPAPVPDGPHPKTSRAAAVRAATRGALNMVIDIAASSPGACDRLHKTPPRDRASEKQDAGLPCAHRPPDTYLLPSAARLPSAKKNEATKRR